MKRTRFLAATIAAASLAGFSFTACEKAPDKGAQQPAPPAQPGETTKPAAPATSAEAAKPATPAPAADVAKIAGAYGFLAKLPKDVEAFDASYRLHDLWTALANSKWAETLLNIEPLKSEPGFAQVREQWGSPQGEQVREVLAEVFGREFVVAMPAGFAAQVEPWVEALSIYYGAILQGQFMALAGGGQLNPQQMQQMLRDAAPELVPALAKCDVPSMIIAAKAAKIRPLVEQGTKQLLSMVGSELPPAIETESFKIADKYEFNAISVTAKKLMAQFQEVQLEMQLKELLADEATAKKAIEDISGKRFEIAWGWVDDYLVISIGKDHNHLKLAAGEGDSVLANPAVAARAGQYLDKKPFGVSFMAKPLLDKINTGMEFAKEFESIAGELAGILKEDQIAAMVADVRKLETKAQTVFKSENSDQVAVSWWEAGLRMESFGGIKSAGVDSSKPLAFSGLASPGTFLLITGRADGALAKAQTDFVEEAAATIWGWYEKYGRTMVPEGERQGAAMIESVGIPMVKDLWKASRKLGDALGNESAFIFDTVGKVPQLPDVPPFIAEGKMPRLAFVAEMKDRAAVSAAWTGFAGLIKQVVALVGGDAGGPEIPEPQMKKEGDVEIHFVPLPFDTGDLLPHIAITKDRWMLSTSPSLSAELAAKPANNAGEALGGHILMNMTALYDHVDVWLGVLDKNAETIMGPNAQEYQSARPLIGTALKLARSLQGLEVKMSEEAGSPRTSMHLKLQDVK